VQFEAWRICWQDEVDHVKPVGFYEKKEKVMLYTGTITKAGKRHMKYNTNSCNECTGAVVIVMDYNHPDFGKAIAIQSHRLQS
jgi:hypothetical protein